MKKRYAKFTAAILAAAFLLCGCEKIPDNSDTTSSTESSVTSGDTSKPTGLDTVAPKEFPVSTQDFLNKFEAEKGSFNGTAKDEQGNELQHANMGGYVELGNGQHLSQVVMLPASQFYRVILSARSSTGATLSFSVGDIVEGSYYVPPSGEIDSESVDEYGYCLFAIDCLYMSVGMNTLQLNVESGVAEIDCLIVENSDAVSASLYRIGDACVTPNACERVVELVRMFAANYGKYTFTAQNVSCGTNAEIDAVYKEIKRFPAIRISELALALKEDSHSVETMEKDLELAGRWDSDGGICAYTWHWYSPNAVRGTGMKDFDVHTALWGIDPGEIATLDDGGMQLQLENDLITDGAAALLKDIDKLAETLRPFSDQGIPILFEPIPDGDTGLFWWGADAESYRSLWVIIFDRLTKYHGITDLVWVWNNSDFSFYPGDGYVDIIGQSFYEKTTSSFAGRFSALASDTKTGRKMLAVTACDMIPSVDFMFRDNAVWLWTAADSGEYVIDRTGAYSELYNKRTAIRNMYNNEKCITRDELEEFGY